MEGKKIQEVNLINFLKSNVHKDIKTQENECNKYIDDWQTANNKTYPQTDDITVLGIKLNN